MNEKQKAYTVKQIKKCNEELKENEKEIKRSLNCMLISIMIAYICFKGMPVDIDIFNEVLSKMGHKMRELVGVCTSILSFAFIFDIIENLCEKAGIQTTIANLEYHLKLAELGSEELEVKHKL